MQQGHTLVIVQQSQPFPYGCYMGLGITQMVLGLISIICYAAKLGTISGSEQIKIILSYPPVAGWYAAIFIACIVLIITGILGVLMTPKKEKRVPLGCAFCGMSGFGSVVSFFLWIGAGVDAYLSIGLYILFGVQDNAANRVAIQATVTASWVAAACGLAAFIITIVSYSVWCCKCCGTVHTPPNDGNVEMGQVAGMQTPDYKY